MLLHASSLAKSYEGVPALRTVDFSLRPGEIHALVGENGAGKSTLCRILCGLLRPDSGAMRLREQPYAPRRRRDAADAGVRMVTQELNLIPTLTVAESICLDDMPHVLGFVNRPELRRRAIAAMDRVGLKGIRPEMPIASLGVGQCQLVEIAAALARRCDLLILDEPTAALTDPEIELLFARLDELRRQGVGIIYVSHRLEEIRRIADRVTVLRDGRHVATHDISQISLDQIITLMVGRDLSSAPMRSRRRDLAAAPLALRAQQLARRPMVRDVSFELRRGELLGIAGLMGSGRTETLRLLFGADQPDSGHIFLGSAANPTRLRSPRDAVHHGIALLTEDRKSQGLLLPMSIRANATLAKLAGVSRMGVISPPAERTVAQGFVDTLKIRCRGTEMPVRQLSGGNQQKVVLAKWLYRDCDLLLFDEPTRGIDIGAKFEIYRLLDDLAAAGKSIIVVSSELPELMGLCDRIAVMSNGKLVRVFNHDHWSQDLIMQAALSEY